MKVIFKFDKEEHIYYIDDDELQEEKEDCEMDNNEFDNYIRPLSINTCNIDSLNGNHYLFGWFESYYQSDRIPYSWWELDTDSLLELKR